jgi:hypothetical protein
MFNHHYMDRKSVRKLVIEQKGSNRCNAGMLVLPEFVFYSYRAGGEKMNSKGLSMSMEMNSGSAKHN